ncbi:MAG: hypothetical protein ACRELF_27955 [Gemmataceae bacterium]
MSGPIVVKVGGSLYDVPDLGARLRDWLGEHCSHGALLIPGGGPAADVIRQFDERHGLGEEKAHWLALRAMTLNAHFLAALLPPADVIPIYRFARNDKSRIAILDVHEFVRGDEARPGRLPHSWAVTSDAVAARVAVATQARQLVLLKSTTIPPNVDWRQAARLGWVDAMFAEVLRQAPPDLHVSAVNLRTWPN